MHIQSYLWVLSCSFNLLLLLNAFSHLSRHITSLLCGFFHAPSIQLCCWMLSQILSMKMASLLCQFFQAASIHFCCWMLSHILSTKMASLLCGFFHASSIHFCCRMLSHIEQENGFSPVWVLSWSLNPLMLLNAFSHFEHENGFSPVWVLSCFFKQSHFCSLDNYQKFSFVLIYVVRINPVDYNLSMIQSLSMAISIV